MFETKIETDIILGHTRTTVTYEVTNIYQTYMYSELVFNFSVVEQPLFSDFRMEYNIG